MRSTRNKEAIITIKEAPQEDGEVSVEEEINLEDGDEILERDNLLDGDDPLASPREVQLEDIFSEGTSLTPFTSPNCSNNEESGIYYEGQLIHSVEPTTSSGSGTSSSQLAPPIPPTSPPRVNSPPVQPIPPISPPENNGQPIPQVQSSSPL